MTNGVLSILDDDMNVKFKIIAGCGGNNINSLKKVIGSKRNFNMTELYYLALEHSFGSVDDLVVMSKHGHLYLGGDELHSRYSETFNDPKFNPRWEVGTCSNTAVLHPIKKSEVTVDLKTSNSRKEVQFLYTTTITSEEDGELVYFDSEKRTVFAKTSDDANRKLYEELWEGNFYETCGSVVSFINPIDSIEYPIEEFKNQKNEINAFFNSSITQKLERQIDRLTKKMERMKEEHGDNPHERYTYYGGWDLGYLVGKIAGMENTLDELRERNILDVTALENISEEQSKIKQ